MPLNFCLGIWKAGLCFESIQGILYPLDIQVTRMSSSIEFWKCTALLKCVTNLNTLTILAIFHSNFFTLHLIFTCVDFSQWFILICYFSNCQRTLFSMTHKGLYYKTLSIRNYGHKINSFGLLSKAFRISARQLSQVQSYLRIQKVL